MSTSLWGKNRTLYLGLMAIGVICISNIRQVSSETTFAQAKTATENKQLMILAIGVELIEITTSAPKCGNQKGQTIRLRVTSENPIDVRLYVQTGYKQWLPKDFPNQKRGDEITDYRCDLKPNYKVYAHATGSNDAWPKP